MAQEFTPGTLTRMPAANSSPPDPAAPPSLGWWPWTVLILLPFAIYGRSLFFGKMEDARTAFTAVDQDNSLEEVFFRATESQAMQ